MNIMYTARIYITLKAAVNDPQGIAVLGGLQNMGYNSVRDVRIGKYMEVEVDETDQLSAESIIEEVCGRLLANPVIEDFRFEFDHEHND